MKPKGRDVKFMGLRVNKIVRHVYYYSTGTFLKNKFLAKAKARLEEFGIQFESNEQKQKQLADMLRMYKLYGFGFDEYLYFHFAGKPMSERLSFVADWEHSTYTYAMNNRNNDVLFVNKYETYKKYKKFYKRDVALIEGEKDKENFFSFVDKHPEFIVKPFNDSAGRGIKIINWGGVTESKNDLFNTLLADYKNTFLIEELIKQSPEMAKFHPSSVNTVRVSTVRFDDEILILHPFFRTGRGDNCVDNAGAGGVFGVVDPESGIVTQVADEKGISYSIHPDTKEKIIGFKIPKWDELISFAKELAYVTPDNRYTGWDLALTDSGWVMVEGNNMGQFLWQIPTQKGFRDEQNNILKRLGINRLKLFLSC